MKPIRGISRRSFLVRVSGGALGAGSFLALTGCATTGYTDSDPYDPVGGGQGGWGGRRGYSDNDPGDPIGRGRGGRGGYSDSDPTDPAGQGGVCSDSDRGRNADPVGRGRFCGGGGGYSDNDRGKYADPPGRGRGRR